MIKTKRESNEKRQQMARRRVHLCYWFSRLVVRTPATVVVRSEEHFIYFSHFFSAKVYVPRRHFSRREQLCAFRRPSCCSSRFFLVRLFALIYAIYKLYMYIFCRCRRRRRRRRRRSYFDSTLSTPRLSKCQPNTSRAASRWYRLQGAYMIYSHKRWGCGSIHRSCSFWFHL